jgi:formylmethanofuran dehydrogenase subunit C
MIEIDAHGESCLCDFTFDFYWQHQGSRLDPDGAISGATTWRGLVEALRRGGPCGSGGTSAAASGRA